MAERVSESHTTTRIYRRTEERAWPFVPWGLILVLLFLALLLYGCTYFASVEIEDEVRDNVASALREAGMDDVAVEVSGQDVALRGTGSAEREARAREIAEAAMGRTWAGDLASPIAVSTDFSLPEPAPPSAPEPAARPAPRVAVWADMQASLRGGVFLLRGAVDSRETRDGLVSLAREAIAPPRIESVQDELEVVQEPVRAGSAVLASRAVRALLGCAQGVASVQGGVLSLRCSASSGDAERVREIASAALESSGGDPASQGTIGTIEVIAAEDVQACEESLAELLRGRSIEFASGSAALRPQSSPLLARVAEVARDCPGTLRVEGHTDDTGTPDGNLQLSRARAESVRRDLIARGLAADRLVAEGFGFNRPLVEGTSAAARARNRRIEFRVIFQDSETTKGQP